MWPLAPIFTAGLVFVLVVLAVMAARLLRERRELVAGECPDDPGRSRALVLVHRTPDPDGRTVVDCSHWHDGRPDGCRQGCIARNGREVGPRVAGGAPQPA